MAARSWDAVVIGAGHNALVAAAYLAKGGQRTLVLERRERVGGAADTSVLAPGIRVPTLAHTVGRLRPSVVRDLRLARHGLSLIAPDVRVFAPRADGGALTFWSDVARTAAGLTATTSGADAAAYPRFDRLVRSLGRFVDEIGRSTPPDITTPRLADALMALRLGRSFRGLGRAGSRTILRVLPMAIADLVAESFETNAVRGALAWRGVRYGAVGPWSGGTAAMLLTDGAGNDGGAAGETVFARGGPGGLGEALASAARAAGAEIRTSADVVQIDARDGRVHGVVLAGGEEIPARAVVSGADPKRTLLGLLDPVVLGPSLGWRTANIRTPGVVAKVNLALGLLPRFPSVTDESVLRGRIVLAPGIEAIERAFDASKYGRWSETPILEATIPSLADPSLVQGAPAGTHVMSVIAQYAPYELRDGTWDTNRERFGDAVIATLEGVAPGIGKLVTHREVLTPVDLESRFGLTGGHPLHGEAGLDQFYLWRPLLGHARYRLPVAGLYLAGSGAHPGGGITGGPGQNAAREILSDLR